MTEAVFEPRVPGPIGDDEAWNESLYTFWYDRARGVAGWHRLAQRPNRGTIGTFTCLVTPTGLRYRHHDEQGPVNPDARAGVWRGSGLEIGWEGDEQRLRYASADCEVDLGWTGLHDIVDYRRVALAYDDALAEVAAEHIEQAGTVRGTVRVGDEHYEVEALAHRDHSWGRRHLTTLHCSRWFVGTTGPELSWSAAKVLLGDIVAEVGYVVRNGAVNAVRSIDVTQTAEVDGLSYRAARAVLGLDDGSELTVALEDVIAGGILRDEPWVGLECAATARSGDLVGIGNCETCNNLTGGSEVPPFLVSGGAVGEGLSRVPE